MHEMALAEGILRIVLDAAEGEKVRKVRLQVGQLRMVMPGSLEFSFRLMAAATPADGAAIEMNEITAALRCAQCEAEIDLDLPPFNCRRCGSSDIDIRSGDEIVIDAVELENGETIGRRVVPFSNLIEQPVDAHAISGGSRYV